MSINQRQFDKLTEMGISLWHSKNSALSEHTNATNTIKDQQVYDLQNNTTLSELTKQALFTDILQSVDISIGEVNHKIDHLDLGIFNWFFITPSENEQVIHCKNSNLYSPSLKVISQSPLLKKQLWQVINQNLL